MVGIQGFQYYIHPETINGQPLIFIHAIEYSERGGSKYKSSIRHQPLVNPKYEDRMIAVTVHIVKLLEKNYSSL